MKSPPSTANNINDPSISAIEMCPIKNVLVNNFYRGRVFNESYTMNFWFDTENAHGRKSPLSVPIYSKYNTLYII